MHTKQTVTDLSTEQKSDEFIEKPTICPHCSVSIDAKILYAALLSDPEDEEESVVYALNFCSYCNKCFLSFHQYNDNSDVFTFISSAPNAKSISNFSDNIANLSPKFVETYSDSLSAENSGLLSICGMGYRKALEFLVKDYIIHNNSNLASDIKKKPLAKCIVDHITDERLKKLATASAWIGNDETHYVRKHSNYDFKDLKIFINAFITYIDAELAVEKAEMLLSNPK